MKTFCERVAHSRREVWVMKGGFSAFFEMFPYLCLSGPSFGGDLTPTPHYIAEGVFLGSRACTLTPELLRGLHIGFVVVDASYKLKNTLINGVQYLACAVEDNNAQAMEICWDTVIGFIERTIPPLQKTPPSVNPKTLLINYFSRSSGCSSAYNNSGSSSSSSSSNSSSSNSSSSNSSSSGGNNGGGHSGSHSAGGSGNTHESRMEDAKSVEGGEFGPNVLIMLHGRSRSASAVIAWLISRRGWTVEEAMAFLNDQGVVIDSSLIFWDQLRERQAASNKRITA